MVESSQMSRRNRRGIHKIIVVDFISPEKQIINENDKLSIHGLSLKAWEKLKEIRSNLFGEERLEEINDSEFFNDLVNLEEFGLKESDLINLELPENIINHIKTCKNCAKDIAEMIKQSEETVIDSIVDETFAKSTEEIIKNFTKKDFDSLDRIKQRLFSLPEISKRAFIKLKN